MDQCDEKTRTSLRTELVKAASGRGSTVRGVSYMVEDRRWVAIDGRIEESINLSREEVRSSVRTSREIDPIVVGDNRGG